jgi:hypothetical protein
MYFSAQHINIKKNQDYSGVYISDELKALVLCDGIGEFEESGKIAELVVNLLIEGKGKSISNLLHENRLINQMNNSTQGGTTILFAKTIDNSQEIIIEYLGNGSIIHFAGDFADNPNSGLPYRYAEIMLPHVTPNGTLNKHISIRSGKKEFSYSLIKLKLNNVGGNILLFYTDGISSLEDKIILQNNDGRYWRSESATIQYILKELNTFLENNLTRDNFQDNLFKFNKKILNDLKVNDYLEDDASIGIILTESVIEYYQSKSK